MNRILTILFLIATTTFLGSCHKYLDIVPKGKIIPEKTNDYRLLLDQTSANGKSNGFTNSFGNDVFMSDDIMVTSFSVNFYDAPSQNVLSFAEHIYQDFESDPDWDALYNQIYVSNLVINQVMDSKEGTETEKKQLLSEAKVHRAFAFLTLVNLYAKPYNATTAASDPGVPLRLGIDFEESLQRASVQGVYDLIIKDINDAITGLPDAAPQTNLNFRPVKSAAYVLLARTYLFMNKINEAFQNADASLQLYQKLIDYNTLPNSSLIPGMLQFPMGLQNSEESLYKTTNSSASLFYADSALMHLYDIQHDLRVPTLYFNDALFGLNFGYISSEWSGRTPVKGTSVPEALLIRAECYARNGKVTEAMADVNTIRQKRFKTGSDYVLSATDAGDALKKVKEERRRELAFRGVRWFDIRRYNAFDNDNITVTHILNGQTYSLAPNSARTVLPIGRKYITLNPEITQNPR